MTIPPLHEGDFTQKTLSGQIVAWTAPTMSTGVDGALFCYAGSDAYADFQRSTDAFAAILPGIVDSISNEAQKFYNLNFSGGDPTPVKLKLGVTTPPSFSGTNQQTSDFKVPIIERRRSGSHL